MVERAANNNMFLYVKINQVQLLVSFKGEKDKNIMDLREFQLTIPVLEYHNNTWTWQDFANKFKSEVKNILLRQILKEKIFRNKKSHNAAASTSNDADGSFCDVTPRHGSMIGRANEEQELSKKVLLMGANYNQHKRNMTSSPPRGSTENLAGNSSRRTSKKLSSQLKNLLKRKKK